MIFTAEEIRLARRLRDLGLSWQPKAGHYVYDATGFCRRSSPFQEKVYFILNYPYFIRNVGGLDRFKEIMIWLPTWEHLREQLRVHGIADQEVADHVSSSRAIRSGTERLVLYQLLETVLANPVAPPAITVD